MREVAQQTLGFHVDIFAEQPDVIAEIDNIINIAGENTSDMTGMLGMMLPIMMLGMVVPMIGEGIEE